ncbi:hypothetical protein X975_13938, partial [Stegodyphus mimosarum]
MSFCFNSAEKISSALQTRTSKCEQHTQMFKETGCLCKGKNSERLYISADNIERIHYMYEQSPQKLTYEGSRHLQMPQKKGMVCSQKEATIHHSTCAAIETGRLWQTYELHLCWKAWRMKQWLIVSFLAMNQTST